jgi:hypothetical protein
MPLSRRSVPSPSRRVRCLLLCLLLALNSLPPGAAQDATQSQPSGKAALRTQGPPGINLPNLDEARRKEHAKPQMRPAKPPVKCGYRDADCQKKEKEKEKTGFHSRPSQAGDLLAMLAWNRGAFDGPLAGAFGLRAEDSRRDYAPLALAAPALTPMAAQNQLNPTEVLETRLDARNRVGESGEDLLSGNFNWSAPLIGLPGRAGMDFGLSLSYNSLVWLKVG